MRTSRFAAATLASIFAVLATASLRPASALADPPMPPLPYTLGVDIGWYVPCGPPICPTYACPDKPFPVHVWGLFPDDCWAVRKVEFVPSPATVIGPPTIRILLDDRACLDVACTAVPTPWSADTLLWGLPAGEYRLRVEVVHVSCSDSFPPDSLHAANFDFHVGSSSWCPPDTLPSYVDRIRVGQPPCAGCPPVVCANEPFLVTLAGTLPNDCVTFNGLSLVPVVNIQPGPPIVRATFGINDCLGRPCTLQARPWTASILLPPLPAGGNGLTVQSMQVSWCDSTRVIALEEAHRPFMVQDTCPPLTRGCLTYDWAPAPASWGGCNATFVNDTASVDLRLASPMALAGLQGVLRTQSGLEIRGLHPTGPAAGMTLEWMRTYGGARFVLFATDGAPIPPFAQAPEDTAFQFAPVLRVEVEAVPYAHNDRDLPITVFALRADSLLGADSLGHGVPACLLRCLDTAGNRCAPPVARFCVGSGCDVNHDGRSDVRDLVHMVRCLFARGCLDTSTRYDCNGDSLFSIQDVICCARAMLNGYPLPGSGGRPDPSVGLAFGEPVRSGEGLELPFTLAGADRVGAARLILRFPSERYDVEGFGLVGDPPGWLALHEVNGNDVIIALIATDASQAGANLPLSLRLRLRPGAEHGGEVVAREADVSAADGASLETAIAGSGAVVDPASPIALSPAWPNPAPGAVRFSLSLPRATDVELAVHDLAGRRVATLHRGALAAGVHAFEWNGSTDRGDAARDGVYFIRLRAGGTEVASKAVLMRGR